MKSQERADLHGRLQSLKSLLDLFVIELRLQWVDLVQFFPGGLDFLKCRWPIRRQDLYVEILCIIGSVSHDHLLAYYVVGLPEWKVLIAPQDAQASPIVRHTAALAPSCVFL